MGRNCANAWKLTLVIGAVLDKIVVVIVLNVNAVFTGIVDQSTDELSVMQKEARCSPLSLQRPPMLPNYTMFY